MGKIGNTIGLASLGLVVAMVTAVMSDWKAAAAEFTYTPQFNGKGELLRPKNHIWREWPFVGTPLSGYARAGTKARRVHLQVF